MRSGKKTIAVKFGTLQSTWKMVDKLVDPQKLIPKWPWAKQRGSLLYPAEPQRFRNWHQIAVELGKEEQIMVELKTERLLGSLFKKHLQISSTRCHHLSVRQ